MKNHNEALLESLFNHIALPRKLPGSSEANINVIECALIERVLLAAKKLSELDNAGPWELLRRSLQSCKTLNVDRKLDQSSLRREFESLQHSEVLILHVTEQNAALTVYRQRELVDIRPSILI